MLTQAKGSGLALFAECFDAPSLELAVEAGADAYKVHTTDMENKDFIRAVADVGKPIFFATGGVHEEALADALAIVGARELGLLFGFQTFPTPVEEIRFRELESMKSRYRVPIGFLDHTDGGTLFALMAPALSVTYGADLVEKHFTLDRSKKGFDYQSSLNPEDFHRMVEMIRTAELARGEAGQPMSVAADGYHRKMARFIVAKTLIGRGDVITAEKLDFKRIDPNKDPGLSPRGDEPRSSAATPGTRSKPTRPSARTCSIEPNRVPGDRAHGFCALSRQGASGTAPRRTAPRGSHRPHADVEDGRRSGAGNVGESGE